MNKIPVFRTIGRAYGFTFGNLGTIIGLIWLPMLVLVSLQYYVTVRYMTGYLSAFADGNVYELNSATGLRYLSVVVALMLQAILVTPVMRQALGLRSGGAFVSFAIGPTSLRVFGAMAALALVLIAIEYIAVISFVFVGLAAVVAAKAVGTIHGVASTVTGFVAVLGLVLIVVAALVFISIRLSFLVVAVAVAERKIDLIRAWRLTGSGFWRIFAVIFATGVPLAILYVALTWAALGFPVPRVPPPAVMEGWKGAPTKALAWIVQALVGGMPFVFGVGFLLAPFSVGLSTGAAAAAYRALVPLQKSDGPTGTAAPETSAV
jgi:hypothetical protein